MRSRLLTLAATALATLAASTAIVVAAAPAHATSAPTGVMFFGDCPTSFFGTIYRESPDGTGKTAIGFNGNHPRVSPNGQQVAYFSGDFGAVFVVSANGGPVLHTLLAGTNSYFGNDLAWSPDSTQLAVIGTTQDGNNRTPFIRTYDVATGSYTEDDTTYGAQSIDWHGNQWLVSWTRSDVPNIGTGQVYGEIGTGAPGSASFSVLAPDAPILDANGRPENGAGIGRFRPDGTPAWLGFDSSHNGLYVNGSFWLNLGPTLSWAFSPDGADVGAVRTGNGLRNVDIIDYGGPFVTTLYSSSTVCGVDWGPSAPPPAAVATAEPTGNPGEWRLDGSQSSAIGDATIVKYEWTVPGVGTLTGTTPTVTIPHDSLPVTVTLKVTDSAGQTATITVSLADRIKVSQVTVAPDPLDVNSSDPTATVKVRNDGAWPLTGVTPTLTSTTPSLLSVSGDPDPPSADTLAPGATTSFDFPLAPLDNGSASLDASASADDAGTTLSDGPVHRAVTIGASLSAELTLDPSTIGVGQPSTAHLKVTNHLGFAIDTVTPDLTVSPTDHESTTGPTGGSSSLADGESTIFDYQLTGAAEQTFVVDGQVTARSVVDGSTVTSNTAEKDLNVVGSDLTVNVTGDGDLTDDARTNDYCDTDTETDGNQCTLRAAIELANARAAAAGTSISFNISGDAVPRISPGTALPPVTAKVTIDGTTQAAGWVELNGAAAPSGSNGLEVDGAGSTVRGMVINGFSSGAGVLAGGTGGGQSITGDRIGTDTTGTTSVANQYGVRVEAPDVTIGGAGAGPGCSGDCDLISGNALDGVRIEGFPDFSNASATVVGDTIGADVTGEHALGNGRAGIDVRAGSAAENTARATIGGPTATPGVAPGNLISGNQLYGVFLQNLHATVQGNLIGVDRAGTASLQPAGPSANPADGGDGIDLEGRSHAVIGGPDVADRNIISGFPNAGIYVRTPAQEQEVVQNNRIGTSMAGDAAIANRIGLLFVGEADDNLISGNTDVGAEEVGVLKGNLIGTSASGTAALPNGVGADDVSDIGGVRPSRSTTCVDPCNLIAGNEGPGILVQNVGNFRIRGNFLGVTLGGTQALPNATAPSAGTPASDIAINHSSGGDIGGPSNAVSAVCDQACNLIDNSPAAGVDLAQVADWRVTGNVIGLGVDGSAQPNGGDGVRITDENTGDFPQTPGAVTVGGDDSTGNLVVGNSGAGIVAATAGAVAVEGNAMYGNSGGGYAGGTTFQPAIQSAIRDGTTVTLAGTDAYSGRGDSSRIDVYAETSCPPAPQGRLPLGHVQSVVIGSGWNFAAPVVPASYHYVVATSTHDGITSPFTSCLAITTTVGQGDATLVSGSGFQSDEPVQATLHSTPMDLGTLTADAQGDVDGSVTIPADTPIGDHTITLTGLFSGHVVEIPLLVHGSSGSGGGGLPATIGPAFTSPSAATFTVGSPGSFLVTTTGTPAVTSITATGKLPAGLLFHDNGDGTATFSGTPTGVMSTVIGLVATNGTGTAEQDLRILVDPVATWTLLTSSGRVVTRQPLTVTAGVFAIRSSLHPTGTVTFAARWAHGAVPLACPTATVTNGVARCRTTALTAVHSPYTIVATYHPDAASFTGSGAQLTQSVARAATTTTLQLSHRTLRVGRERRERFTVTVRSAFAGRGSGWAVVTAGHRKLCSAVLVAGIAKCHPARSALGAGLHTLVAHYYGTGNYRGSASAPVRLRVRP